MNKNEAISKGIADPIFSDYSSFKLCSSLENLYPENYYRKDKQGNLTTELKNNQ